MMLNKDYSLEIIRPNSLHPFRRTRQVRLLLWLVAGLLLLGGCGETTPQPAPGSDSLADLGRDSGNRPGDLRAEVIPSDLFIPDNVVDLVYPPDSLLPDLRPDLADAWELLPETTDADATELVDDIAPDLDAVELEDFPDLATDVPCPGGGWLVSEDCGSVPPLGCCWGETLLRCLDGDDCPAGAGVCLCEIACDEGEGNPLEDASTPFCSVLGSSQPLGCASERQFPPPGNLGNFWCEGYDCDPLCGGRVCGPDACGEVCGTCSEGEFCTEQGQCEASCQPETDAALCLAAGFDCGPLQVTDSCGQDRQLDCGSCTLPKTCGGGSEVGRCGCTSIDDEELCLLWEADCGEVTAEDNCGQQRTVTCGPACEESCPEVGATRCAGNAIQICEASGSHLWWSQESTPCEEGAWCSAGECTTTPVPPDPADIAPPLDPLAPYNMYDANSFLWTSQDPVQFGVQEGAISPKRIAMLHGRVLDFEGLPLSGVKVHNAFDSTVGFTVTRSDGFFDLADNGGANITLNFEKEGYLPIQRTFQTRWQLDYPLPEVRLLTRDPIGTPIALDSTTTEMQVAEGSTAVDNDGERTVRALFPPGVTAQMIFPDGTIEALPGTSTIRFTEYTVGYDGAQSMPATLPSTVQYTWCAEFEVDEAVAAGAHRVEFSEPIVVYVENFMGFPVGARVPVGSYDRLTARWAGEENGLVLSLLDVEEGLARLDLDGSGTPGSTEMLADMGVTDEERAWLAETFSPGQTLWRVRVDHFTPWDFNWLRTFSSNRDQSRRSRPSADDSDTLCEDGGCVVLPIEQRLQERIAIPEAPVELVYDSLRVPGKTPAVRVPVRQETGELVPVVAGRVDIAIAQRSFGKNFYDDEALVELDWDGLDLYGRRVSSPIVSLVTKRYNYAPQYYAQLGWILFPPGFGALSPQGTYFGVDGVSRDVEYPVSSFSDEVVVFPALDERPWGLGGWSVAQHHRFYPNAELLLEGNGKRRFVRVAGATVSRQLKCKHPAVPSMEIPCVPTSYTGSYVVVDPAGRVFVGDSYIDEEGILSKEIGGGTSGLGDGYLSSEVALGTILGNTIAPNGDMYFTSSQSHLLWRRDQEGRIWRVAGAKGTICSADCPPLEDGTVARNVDLTVSTFAVDSDGSVLFKTTTEGPTWRIDISGVAHQVGKTQPNSHKRFDPTVGSLNDTYMEKTYAYAGCPDGSIVMMAYDSLGLATETGNPGVLILRTWPDHSFSIIGGGGPIQTLSETTPAMGAPLQLASRMVCAQDGSILFTQPLLSSDGAGQLLVRMKDGIMTAVAGGGAGVQKADDIAALAATFQYITDFAMAPDGTLYINSMNELYHVTPDLEHENLGEEELAILSEDGDLRYVFQKVTYRHLRTERTVSGEALLTFEYNPLGQLETIVDSSGRETRIHRYNATLPTAIESPSGLLTELTLDDNGYLSRIAPPNTSPYEFTYDSLGLLQTAVYPDGGIHQYSYDESGCLSSVQRPDQSITTYDRQETHDQLSVTLETTGHPVEEHRYNYPLDDGGTTYSHWVDGEETVRIETLGNRTIRSHPGGTSLEVETSPDPEHPGASYTSRLELKTPAGRTLTAETERNLEIDTESGSVARHITTTRVDGAVPGTVREFDHVANTLTVTTPSGRQEILELDPAGRLLQKQAAGLAPLIAERDEFGRITAISRGGIRIERDYDEAGRLVALKDALGRWRHVLRDEYGRVIQQELMQDVTVQFGHDDAGRVNRITLPGGTVWQMEYTPWDKLARLIFPGSSVQEKTYQQGLLYQTQLPSGRTITVQRGANREFRGFITPESVLELTGDSVCCPQNLDATMTLVGSGLVQSTAVERDGPLLTATENTGAAPARFEFNYPGTSTNPDALTITSGSDMSVLDMVLDADGLLEQFGPVQWVRIGPAGLATEYDDGIGHWKLTIDEMGRLVGKELTIQGASVYSLVLSVDPEGRVTEKTEVLLGTENHWTFAYDDLDRLTAVVKDEVPVETYNYDDRGNRLSWWTQDSGEHEIAVDANDRVTSLDGQPQSFNVDGQCTSLRGLTLSYASRGELLSSESDGTTTQYAYDLLGRQVLQQHPAGERQIHYGPAGSPWFPQMDRLEDGTVNVHLRDELGALILLIRDGVPYYVAADQVGTPRAVFDATGAVVKEIRRDSFGRLLHDSAPEWVLSIGFAGGVEEPRSGLVRFGVRDYDPMTGRFLTIDPLLFNGNQYHLYAYASNDPLAMRDPSGLFCVGGSVFSVVGIGGEVCLDEDGFSACAEGGVGVGGGFDLDFFGEHADTDWGVELEANAEILGFGAEMNYEITRCKGMRQSFEFGGPLGSNTYESSYDVNKEEWESWHAAEGDPGSFAEQAYNEIDGYKAIMDLVHDIQSGKLKASAKASSGASATATAKGCVGYDW